MSVPHSVRERLRARERAQHEFVFRYPRGRICLVEQCKDCRRFCQFTGYFQRRRYGTIVAQPPRFMWESFSAGRICSDCQDNNRSWSPLDQCSSCGRLARANAAGVVPRRLPISRGYGSTAEYWRQHAWDDNKLCVPCWNKIRHINKRLLEVDEIRLSISRAHRLIASMKKEGQHAVEHS